MNVCIIGASGYSGRELVSLLLDHPYAKLTTITSRSLDGQKLEDCLPKLRGKDRGLRFSNPSREQLCQDLPWRFSFSHYPMEPLPVMPFPFWKRVRKSSIFRLISGSVLPSATKSTTVRNILPLPGLSKLNTDCPSFTIYLGKSLL